LNETFNRIPKFYFAEAQRTQSYYLRYYLLNIKIFLCYIIFIRIISALTIRIICRILQHGGGVHGV